MKKALTKTARITVAMLRENRELIVDLIGDIHPGLRGNVSELRGDVSGLRGDVSGLRGDGFGLRGDVSELRGNVSGLRGNVSGLRGDVSGLRGNVDDCEISDEDRKNGVNIADLCE